MMALGRRIRIGIFGACSALLWGCGTAASTAPEQPVDGTSLVWNFLDDARCAPMAPDSNAATRDQLQAGWYYLADILARSPHHAKAARDWFDMDEVADKICYFDVSGWDGSTQKLIEQHVSGLQALARRL